MPFFSFLPFLIFVLKADSDTAVARQAFLGFAVIYYRILVFAFLLYILFSCGRNMLVLFTLVEYLGYLSSYRPSFVQMEIV